MSDNNDKDDKTVVFDVGGRLYRVSRSLLEAFPETLPTRAASDTWRTDNRRPVFIDRDSERFRYILDYMRDGIVHLPLTESKTALLHEFEYYGFANVKDDVVNTRDAHVTAATALEDHTEEQAKLSEQEAYARYAARFAALASTASSSAGGDKTVLQKAFAWTRNRNSVDDELDFLETLRVPIFNTYLEPYDFVVASAEKGPYKYTLKLRRLS